MTKDAPIAINDSTPLVGRDLKKARKAYKADDAEASRSAHDAKHGGEQHKGSAAKYIKSLVYGGMDGILTIFALVCSVEGGNLAPTVIIVLGFASLLADGMSMGIGDYLSSQAEVQYARTERRRETWECDNYLEGEQQEMIELYISKGLSEEDAKTIVGILSKDKDIFVDFMMIEELGIMPDVESESPCKNGAVTFGAFILFGIVPLISYVVSMVALNDTSSNWITFMIACILTAVTLFVLGAVKARFTGQRWYVSAPLMLLIGGVAAGGAYLIGYLVGLLVPHH